jgi:hypothetical protein
MQHVSRTVSEDELQSVADHLAQFVQPQALKPCASFLATLLAGPSSAATTAALLLLKLCTPLMAVALTRAASQSATVHEQAQAVAGVLLGTVVDTAASNVQNSGNGRRNTALFQEDDKSTANHGQPELGKPTTLCGPPWRRVLEPSRFGDGEGRCREPRRGTAGEFILARVTSVCRRLTIANLRPLTHRGQQQR